MNRCTYCFGFTDGLRAGAASIALTGCGTVSVRLYFASVALSVVALAIDRVQIGNRFRRLRLHFGVGAQRLLAHHHPAHESVLRLTNFAGEALVVAAPATAAAAAALRDREPRRQASSSFLNASSCPFTSAGTSLRLAAVVVSSFTWRLSDPKAVPASVTRGCSACISIAMSYCRFRSADVEHDFGIVGDAQRLAVDVLPSTTSATV